MDDALRILNQHRFTVLFSGGRDSTATLLWVYNNIAHSDWNILYVEITGNTHRLCTEYVYYVVDELYLRPRLIHYKTRDFFELMERWGPPLLHSYRWCLYQLKMKAFRTAYKYTVDGIKRADSKSRRRSQLVKLYRATGKIAISPLIDWTSTDVERYIKKNGIKINPCYRVYGHSGNCMFCPYADKRHIVLTMSDPEWGLKIMKVLEKHEDKVRGSMSRSVYERWMRHGRQKTLPIKAL